MMMTLTEGRTRRQPDLDLWQDRTGTWVLSRRGVPFAYFSHEAEARQALECYAPRPGHSARARDDFWPDED